MKIDLNTIKEMERQASIDGIDSLVAGTVVVNDGSILFIKRADHDTMGGKYEFPSGRVDLGENIMDAAERELAEETNFDVKDCIGIVGSFDYTTGAGKKKRQFNFVVSVANIDELILNPEEHSASQWVKFEEIHSSEILCEVMKDISQQAISLLKEIN